MDMRCICGGDGAYVRTRDGKEQYACHESFGCYNVNKSPQTEQAEASSLSAGLVAEDGKWYWMTHPHEGDVWYPIWIGPDYCLFDGKRRPQEDFKNLILKEAILPDGL